MLLLRIFKKKKKKERVQSTCLNMQLCTGTWVRPDGEAGVINSPIHLVTSVINRVIPCDVSTGTTRTAGRCFTLCLDVVNFCAGMSSGKHKGCQSRRGWVKANRGGSGKAGGKIGSKESPKPAKHNKSNTEKKETNRGVSTTCCLFVLSRFHCRI